VAVAAATGVAEVATAAAVAVVGAVAGSSSTPYTTQRLKAVPEGSRESMAAAMTVATIRGLT
jgi:hypothetical protein